jgi:hypothetical protein
MRGKGASQKQKFRKVLHLLVLTSAPFNSNIKHLPAQKLLLLIILRETCASYVYFTKEYVTGPSQICTQLGKSDTQD